MKMYKSLTILFISMLFFLQCSKSKSKDVNSLFPLALLGSNSNGNDETPQQTGNTNEGDQNQSDPVDMYLQNIRSGKYQIKPRGETVSYLSSKIKSSGLEDTSSSSDTKSVRKVNNNGPQKEGNVDEVWINIKEIQFVSDSGPKITVPSNLNSVDLLKLKDNATVLFSKAIVPEGKYSQIRLILNEPNGKIVKDGVEYSLKVPSGSQTGLKLNGEIDLVSGLLLEFTLDFELHSLKYTPGQGYILRPTVPISSIKTLLPFIHGMLIVKFKNQVTVSTNPDGIPTTGISNVDTILKEHNCIVIKKFIDNFSKMDMEVAGEVGLDRVYLFSFKPEQDVLLAMFDLSQDPNIELVSPNHYMESSETVPNDPEANKNCSTCNRRQQTHLTAINAYNGWDITTGNRNVRIAVIDNGVDDQHLDLVGKVIQNRSFYIGSCWLIDIYKGIYYHYPCVQVGADSKPLNYPKGYHGTHVAGIIGALSNNGVGISGINWESEILAIRVFQENSSICNNAIEGACVNEISVASGITEAVNLNSKVINLSLGQDGYEYTNFGQRFFTHPLEFGAVRYADKKRVTVVAAAGNYKREISGYPGSNSFKGYYPASFNEVISVSGLSQDGTQLYSNTNYGKVEISAPGVNIYSTIWSENPCTGIYGDNQYCYKSGTSMAAPMVSAFAGLILALDSSLHRQTILEEMCNHATAVNISSDPATNRKYIGCGRINLGDTLQAVKAAVYPKITNTCGGDQEPACSAGRWFDTFSFQFTVESGSPPYKWNYSNGSLPYASNLNEDTGILSGGPTGWFGPGWTFDIKVTVKENPTPNRSTLNRVFEEEIL